MNKKNISVLILAYSKQKSEEIKKYLEHFHCSVSFSLADSIDMLIQFLGKGTYDLILAAEDLEPERILSQAHALCPFTPVIVVVDQLNDENYIELINLGASDCIDSDDLARLSRAVYKSITNATALDEASHKLLMQFDLLNLSEEPIFAWDMNGSIIYWNKGAELTFGYTSEEAIGQFSHALLKTNHPYSLELMIPMLERDRVWTGEVEHITKNGVSLTIKTRHQVFNDGNGKKIVLEISHDITERKMMEAEMKNQNILLNAVIENMQDPLVIYDTNGGIAYINAEGRNQYTNLYMEHTSVEDVFQGYHCLDLNHNSLQLEDYPTRRAFRGETIKNQRIIMQSPNWSKFIEVNASPIYQENKQLTAIVVCHHDISDLIHKQQEIEEQLKQMQQQNKLLNRQTKLLDLSNEAIFAWYLDGPVIYWNQGAEKMYGYADDEAVGCNPHHLLGSHFPIHYDEMKAALIKDGAWSGIIEHTAKDSRLLFCETRLQVIKNELGLNTVLETSRDITERLKAEIAIREKAEELQNIINSTEDYIWSVDRDYRFILYNNEISKVVEKHYGLKINPGLSITEVFPAENAAIFLEFFERVKKDGEFHIDVQPLLGDRLVTYSFFPIYVNAELAEITVFGKDITERIKAEQEIIKLNTSLESRVAERTEALQQSLQVLQTFSVTVTHDLKIPLQEIETYSRQIQEHVNVDSNSVKIIKLCTKMTSMISSLLNYEKASSTQLKKESVDIRKMIVSIYDELKNNNSVLDFETGIPKACADRVLIRQVLVNLLSNALKFSAKQETAEIIVGCSKENNDYVFYIKDNGIGIDPEYTGKLFNVFERLNDADEYEGHGIGLAIVKSVVEKHGGKTWINGKLNKGTTVYFTLPVEEEN